MRMARASAIRDNAERTLTIDLARRRFWVNGVDEPATPRVASIVLLGITVIVTHVGLLFWETRHVSASLAYPGLKPRRTGA